MGENALPIDVEDRERAIQIVGSTTRRVANAVGLYLIFALPSLVMGPVCCHGVQRSPSDGSTWNHRATSPVASIGIDHSCGGRAQLDLDLVDVLACRPRLGGDD